MKTLWFWCVVALWATLLVTVGWPLWLCWVVASGLIGYLFRDAVAAINRDPAGVFSLGTRLAIFFLLPVLLVIGLIIWVVGGWEDLKEIGTGILYAILLGKDTTNAE